MRDVRKAIEDAFYSWTRSETVPFVVNGPVEITAGDNAGRVGAVISIESAHPVMMIRVERGDTGKDVVVQIGQ